jgi:SAM-dependent methyltransferase
VESRTGLLTAALPPAGLRARLATYAGLFLVTSTTLMYEIGLTRIFSVTTWYHFAFLAISVALFGMTVGALLVHLLPNRFRDPNVASALWRYSLLFSISLAVCFVTQLSIPFAPERNIAGLWTVVLTCVVVSVPFVFSGVVVCLALTRFPPQVNRLYATDLVGAAVGCLALVAVFVVLDGPSLMIAIASIAAVGALLFAAEAGSRTGVAFTLVAAVALGGFAAANGWLSSRGDALLRITWVKRSYDPQHAYEKWNVFSRVTVDGSEDSLEVPAGVGMSKRLPPDTRVNQLGMLIDGNAATMLTRYRGDPAQTDFLRYDISSFAHYLRPSSDVFVVGVGGGRDVLAALEFDQRSVTGLEINENVLHVTNEEYGDFTGHLNRDPRVRMVNDEARSYLARTGDRFDVLQISLIDTWAASSAGAFALTENSLYTTEAWNVFLDRLKHGGILSVSRWYETPYTNKPLEIYRTVALAAHVLKERGVARPRDHILVYRSPDNAFGVQAATVLVSPQPFTAGDLATADRETTRLGFTPVLTPTEAIDRYFAGLAASAGPDAVVNEFQEDISPPTDDRPFFFQMADLGTLLSGQGFSNAPSTRPVLILALLLVIVLALAAGLILLPLLLTTRRAAHQGMFPLYTYFAAIGLGFLLIEVAQLQRLTVFLGHPSYALTVVLFSLLVFSGVGSFASERLVRTGRRAALMAPLVALLAVVAAFAFLTPELVDRLDGATTPVRIATAVAVLMPLGLLMGMPFAIGMRAAARRPGAPVAFLWGVNGATSVCASVLGVVIAVFFGISLSYWAGLAAYAVAATSLVAISRPATGAGATVETREPDQPARAAASA